MRTAWLSLSLPSMIILPLVFHGSELACLDEFTYLCGAQQINMTQDLYLAAPGTLPSCDINVAADCTAQIQVEEGMRIRLYAVTRLPSCGGDNYVEWSDGLSTPARPCGDDKPQLISARNTVNVRYRSSSTSNVMSVILNVVGCSIQELITGSNIIVDVTYISTPDSYTATVKCSIGYLITSLYTELPVTCVYQSTHRTYSWNYAGKYSCHAAQCSAPPAVLNTEHNMTLTSYPYLSTVSYACNLGYLISGNRSTQCVTVNNSGAVWSKVSTQCQAAMCSTPPSLFNGFFSPERTSYPFSSAVTYSCNQGYLPKDTSQITCMTDSDVRAIWTVLLATCQPAQCSAPPTVQNAVHSGTLTSYPYLSTVSYTCSLGYLITGNRTSHCMTQNNAAVWSNVFVQCRAAVCSNPPSLSNGTYAPSASRYNYSDIITYSCNEGYAINGNNTIRCTTNNDIEVRWTNLSGSCLPVVCSPPPSIANGFFTPNQSSYLYHSFVMYSCKRGFVLTTGKDRIYCTAARGAPGDWSGGLPSCADVECSFPPKLKNGRYTPDQTSYSFNKSVTYSCDAGYTLSGSSTSTCDTNNNGIAIWSGGNVTCDIVDCGSPSVKNASILAPNITTYGAQFEYICKKPLVPSREQSAKCAVDGTWSFVECSEAKCPNINASTFFTNLTSIPDVPVAGDTVSYHCVLNNFTLTLICLSNGETGYWNSSLPACYNPSHAEITADEISTEASQGAIMGGSIGAVLGLGLVVILLLILILRRQQIIGKIPQQDRSESTTAIVDDRRESAGSGLYADVEFNSARPQPQNGAIVQSPVQKSTKLKQLDQDQSDLYAVINKPKTEESKRTRVSKQKEHPKSHDILAPDNASSQIDATVMARRGTNGSSKQPLVVDKEVELVDNDLYAPTLIAPPKSFAVTNQEIELIESDIYST